MIGKHPSIVQAPFDTGLSARPAARARRGLTWGDEPPRNHSLHRQPCRARRGRPRRGPRLER
jgi:hypothetical protein